MSTNAAVKIPEQYTNPETGKYRPGMDARHAGDVARKVMETGKTSHLKELPSEALRAKASRLVEIWTEKAEAKAIREAARAEAKANREASKSETKTKTKTVKMADKPIILRAKDLEDVAF